MGGYVTLAVRKDSQISTVLSYTGSLVHFFNPRLYLGDEIAISEMLQMYGDCPEISDPSARGLVPFDYGLVVLDFDGKTVFDMQMARALHQSSALFSSPNRTIEFHLPAGRLGWLGKELVDVLTGKPLREFDASIFESGTALAKWCEEVDRSALMSDEIPTFRLSPPGWQLISFGNDDAPRMKVSLEEVGFSFDVRECAAWDTWARDNSSSEHRH